MHIVYDNSSSATLRGICVAEGCPQSCKVRLLEVAGDVRDMTVSRRERQKCMAWIRTNSQGSCVCQLTWMEGLGMEHKLVIAFCLGVQSSQILKVEGLLVGCSTSDYA